MNSQPDRGSGATRSTVAGTERKSARDPMDRYYTPWLVALGVCQEWRHAIQGRVVLDPFAGGGVWLRAALAVGATSARGVDLDEGRPLCWPVKPCSETGSRPSEGRAGWW
jgi:hypothetical protein